MGICAHVCVCVCGWCAVVVCSQVSMGLSSPWLSLCASFTMCCTHVPISPVNQSLCRAASFTAVTVFPLVTNTELVCQFTWVKAPWPQYAGQNGCTYPQGCGYMHGCVTLMYVHTHCGEIPTCICEKIKTINKFEHWHRHTHTESRGYPLPF